MPDEDESVIYRTLAGRGVARFPVQGSEFVGRAAPVGDVDAAEAFVEAVHEEYDDATHNVPAYRVRVGDATKGGGMLREYASDAGVIEEHPHERVGLVVDYDDSGTVRGILESTGVEFDAEYGERVRFDARVPVADAAALRDRLRSATGGRVELE